jgi:hypothetical protein
MAASGTIGLRRTILALKTKFLALLINQSFIQLNLQKCD